MASYSILNAFYVKNLLHMMKQAKNVYAKTFIQDSIKNVSKKHKFALKLIRYLIKSQASANVCQDLYLKTVNVLGN